ncbi:MAG: 16S rRNA (cytidine(1402)-2'-O)-methyltransferase [Chlamydiales bacterium]|nr:16S rRNA (cytidine(1402)-2'-O)-methyltransferase [Chlamydiales bacterium]
MLYLIATPIGNLGDITLRALETLRACDYVLCEDTRRSQRLLAHYEIRKPLKSYHKFNERRRSAEVIADLKAGLNVGLVTDAGTPGICDPGEILVKLCHENSLEVTAIPGACAAVTALSISGFSTERFQLLGFLPKKKGQLTRILEEQLAYPGTSIFYESPYRVLKTLEILNTIAPDLQVAVIRELTKLHEENARGTPQELIARFTAKKPKGEIVLLFPGQE